MKKAKAYTLFEVLFSIGIITFVITLGLPALQAFYQNQHFSLVADELHFAITMAKTQSLIQGVNFYLTPLTENDWSQGIQLIKMNPENQSVVHIWQWKDKNIHVHWHGFYSNSSLFFAPSLQHSVMNGSFTIQSPQKCKKLTLNRLGRIKEANCNAIVQ